MQSAVTILNKEKSGMKKRDPRPVCKKQTISCESIC